VKGWASVAVTSLAITVFAVGLTWVLAWTGRRGTRDLAVA
jgi:hypothetical protein